MRGYLALGLGLLLGMAVAHAVGGTPAIAAAAATQPASRPGAFDIPDLATVEELRLARPIKVDSRWQVRLGLSDGGPDAGPWKLLYCLAGFPDKKAQPDLPPCGELTGDLHGLGPVAFSVDDPSAANAEHMRVAQSMVMTDSSLLYCAGVPMAWKGEYRIRVWTYDCRLLAERTIKVASPQPCLWQSLAEPGEPAGADAATPAATRATGAEVTLSGKLLPRPVAAAPFYHGANVIWAWGYSQERINWQRDRTPLPGLIPPARVYVEEVLEKEAAQGEPNAPAHPPVLTLSVDDGGFSTDVPRLGRRLELHGPAGSRLLARWWVNGKPIAAPPAVAAPAGRAAPAERPRQVGSRMRLALPLPAHLEAKAGDKIALQVLYCPAGWLPLTANRSDCPILSGPLEHAIRGGLLPLPSNRLEFAATSAMLTSSATRPAGGTMPAEPSAGGTAQRPPAPWQLVARNAMASVHVQKMLYDQGPKSLFFIRVRLTNVTYKPIGLDLRNGQKIIYPNQWADLPKPQRDDYDERRRRFPPITAAWDARLIEDFKAGKLVRLEPGQSIDYFLAFNNPMGGRPAGAEYTFISLDGELEMAEEACAARITCETDNSGRALEGVVGTDVYLPPGVEWARIPAGALVFADDKVAGTPATQPAVGPWSQAVDGLRAKIDASRHLTPRLGMEVDLTFKEVAGTSLAIDFDELRALPWKVLDASGKEVPPAKVGKAQPAPDWHALTPGPGMGKILGEPKNNRNGRLEIGLYEWQLQPGWYSLHCLLSTRSEAAGNRTSATPWRGRVELPSAEFEVVGEVSDRDLIEAGKKVRTAYPGGGLAMWRALAELVRPGMTVQQMHLVLPPVKPSAEGGRIGHSGITVWNGSAFFYTYWLDDECVVEASGVGDARGGAATSATSPARGDWDMLLGDTPRIKVQSRGR